jgi:hypothetical protein
MLRGAPSLHKSAGWQGQFDRLKRWHNRIKKVRWQIPGSESAEEYEDYLYAFFMNCYHLQDWLHYSAGISTGDLKQFIDSHPEMQVCRDICNGIKHFNLSTSKRDNHFAIGREYVPQSISGSNPSIKAKIFIISGSDKYDLFHLTNRCMELWVEFLTAQGLL